MYVQETDAVSVWSVGQEHDWSSLACICISVCSVSICVDWVGMIGVV